MQSFVSDNPFFKQLKRQWRWMMGPGLALLLLGMVGLGLAALSTGAAPFGVLMLLGAGIQLLLTLRAEGGRQVMTGLAISFLYGGTGAALLTRPNLAINPQGLMIAGALVAISVMRVISGWLQREQEGWGWSTLGAAMTLLLTAWAVALQSPSALPILSAAIGVELLCAGWTGLAMGLALRKVAYEACALVERWQGPPPAAT